MPRKSPTNSCLAFERHDHRRCQREVLSQANALCQARQLRLTDRRKQVLRVLLASHQPMGAYEILAKINNTQAEQAACAPPIVYRALEFLLTEGLVHRIESKNAFIVCAHPGHQSAAQFLICKGCEQVAELEDNENAMIAGADSLGFAVDHAVVEITGICASCQKQVGSNK